MPKTIQISPEVEAVLARATVDGNMVKLPPGQLERPLYLEVNKVLKALGGKWNTAKYAHVFAGGIDGQLSAALQSGSVVDQKRTLEQFFTPADLAGRMVGLLDIRADMHVLEPSVGNGRLIWEALDRNALVTAVEIDKALCAELAQTICGGLHVFNADFMEWRPVSRIPIDRVIMNPPFSGNQDIAHVTRALGFLRPGGTLVAIMSRHFTFANDGPSKDFRALIDYPQCRPYGKVSDATVETLSDNTFKSEGTGVGAVLVTITKGE